MRGVHEPEARQVAILFGYAVLLVLGAIYGPGYLALTKPAKPPPVPTQKTLSISLQRIWRFGE